MDFKSTLELIDKSFNIEYIYNLYNVFNKTINKYKGLHKYIESKKDVYEKLLLTSKYSDNHEKEIENMREDLELLNTKQCSLQEEYKYNSTILHNKNIDIQLCVKGLETIAWKPREKCQIPNGDYNPDKDVRFFSDAPDMSFQLTDGQFGVFFPEDVHAPMIGDGEIKKVVIKVKI